MTDVCLTDRETEAHLGTYSAQSMLPGTGCTLGPPIPRPEVPFSLLQREKSKQISGIVNREVTGANNDLPRQKASTARDTGGWG